MWRMEENPLVFYAFGQQTWSDMTKFCQSFYTSVEKASTHLHWYLPGKFHLLASVILLFLCWLSISWNTNLFDLCSWKYLFSTVNYQIHCFISTLGKYQCFSRNTLSLRKFRLAVLLQNIMTGCPQVANYKLHPVKIKVVTS